MSFSFERSECHAISVTKQRNREQKTKKGKTRSVVQKKRQMSGKGFAEAQTREAAGERLWNCQKKRLSWREGRCGDWKIQKEEAENKKKGGKRKEKKRKWKRVNARDGRVNVEEWKLNQRTIRRQENHRRKTFLHA